MIWLFYTEVGHGSPLCILRFQISNRITIKTVKTNIILGDKKNDTDW